MPAQYHPQALRCQAVAARTRAAAQRRSNGGSGCARHPDCDLCTDSACCQGWLSENARRTRWQEAFDQYEQRTRSAVSDTASEVLTYHGLPAEILYHACSGGMTEDAAAVFSHSVPYLVSVDSPGEEGYSGFASDTVMTLEEAAARLLAAFPDCGVTPAELPGALRLRSSTASGRIEQIDVGQTSVTGAQFRRALGLRSTLCTWDAADGLMTFHTLGYGHGVGMSQAGAQAMAASGSGYRQILSHYYPGTQLVHLP